MLRCQLKKTDINTKRFKLEVERYRDANKRLCHISGDVPSYMQDVDPEQEPEQEQDPEQGHEKEVYTVGMVKRCKDGSEWLITHFCEVCQVGLCSLKQYESHCAGKPHAKKVSSLSTLIEILIESLQGKCWSLN